MKTVWNILKLILPWLGWLIALAQFLVNNPPPGL